jgi:hypothetical protein
MNRSHEKRFNKPANLARRRAGLVAGGVLLGAGGLAALQAGTHSSAESNKGDTRAAVVQRIQDSVGHKIPVLDGLVSSNFTYNGQLGIREANSQLVVKTSSGEYLVYAPDTFDFASDTVPLSDELIINRVEDPNSIPENEIHDAVLEPDGSFVDPSTGKKLDNIAQAVVLTEPLYKAPASNS